MYRGFKGLLCLLCNSFSWNAQDVILKYCANCHRKLNEVPMNERCDNTDGHAPGFLVGEDNPTYPEVVSIITKEDIVS